ncbi:MAG: four-carbon acid sugar kinase family protein [Betaproteobacteria bacterium]|nr:four-carbon acid sugar kinase family protein [Betaproteobacteria bacterium]
MGIVLGCIADDFTGATDLANNLVRAGMRAVQTIGVPSTPLDADVDAVVVALKSRTIAPAEAIAQSLAALHWLRAQGAQQIYFKYCSTFDSTPKGNIGPVTEALMQALNTDFTIATPAFPDNGRTVFKGHLFVGDVLLSESGMRDHPLTPMTDANLVRVLQAQCQREVGLIDHKAVAQGADAIRARIAQLKAQGVSIAIVDAVSNDDLLRLGPAIATLPLVTAGSGVAIGLPGNFGLKPSPQASALPAAQGLQAVVSGSCSQATNAQVAHFIAQGRPALALDPRAIVREGVGAVAAQALQWAAPLLKQGPVLVYSTAAPEAVRAVQAEVGAARAGEMIEHTLAAIARGLVQAGVRQLVVAGGETSGACVQALGVTQLQIGPQIDPGVPWCHARTDVGGAAVHLALKSGNFGGTDFFSRVFGALA